MRFWRYFWLNQCIGVEKINIIQLKTYIPIGSEHEVFNCFRNVIICASIASISVKFHCRPHSTVSELSSFSISLITSMLTLRQEKKRRSLTWNEIMWEFTIYAYVLSSCFELIIRFHSDWISRSFSLLFFKRLRWALIVCWNVVPVSGGGDGWVGNGCVVDSTHTS